MEKHQRGDSHSRVPYPCILRRETQPMQLCFGGKADLPLGQVWETETETGDGDRREVPFPRDFE